MTSISLRSWAWIILGGAFIPLGVAVLLLPAFLPLGWVCLLAGVLATLLAVALRCRDELERRHAVDDQ